MKKILSISLAAALFTAIGCEEKKPTTGGAKPPSTPTPTGKEGEKKAS